MKHAFTAIASAFAIISTPVSAIDIFSNRSFATQIAAVARAKSITLSEARRRLTLQDKVLLLDSQIQSVPGFVGINLISSRTSFEVHVRIREEGLAEALSLPNIADLADVLKFDVSARSQADLEAAKKEVLNRAAALRLQLSAGIDPSNERVVIRVQDIATAARAMGDLKNFQLFAFEETSEIPIPVADVNGGEKLYTSIGSCTTAFSVVFEGGERGILTAAHCVRTNFGASNGGGYVYTDKVPTLYIRRSDWGGTEDFAWAAGPGQTFNNQVNNGTDYTTITSAYVGVAPNGATLCKYGVKTGFTCQDVRNNNWTAIDPSTGSTIGPMVELYDSVTNIAQCGDSGGPIFVGSVAHGVISRGDYSGSCQGGHGLIFAPIRGIGHLGLSLVTS